jgi:hypothetical protein
MFQKDEYNTEGAKRRCPDKGLFSPLLNERKKSDPREVKTRGMPEWKK